MSLAAAINTFPEHEVTVLLRAATKIEQGIPLSLIELRQLLAFVSEAYTLVDFHYPVQHLYGSDLAEALIALVQALPYVPPALHRRLLQQQTGRCPENLLAPARERFNVLHGGMAMSHQDGTCTVAMREYGRSLWEVIQDPGCERVPAAQLSQALHLYLPTLLTVAKAALFYLHDEQPIFHPAENAFVKAGLETYKPLLDREDDTLRLQVNAFDEYILLGHLTLVSALPHRVIEHHFTFPELRDLLRYFKPLVIEEGALIKVDPCYVKRGVHQESKQTRLTLVRSRTHFTLSERETAALARCLEALESVLAPCWNALNRQWGDL